MTVVLLVRRMGCSRIAARSFASSSNAWNWNDSSLQQNKILRSIEGTPLTTTSIDPRLQTRVLDKCADLHASVMPLNEKLQGPLAKNSNQGTALPFVFLVGNHSSGKSSFVNYILGRDVQVAGVAPTDDTFTVILPGPSDQDQDGPALIGDPDLGFSNLRQFGPTLIHHTQLKVRKNVRNSNFMLVDSPGMIDSPHQAVTTDRGYDFQGVVKWFAERADIVLLFFDPDKPGTTGETLSILLHSLGGMDHKLLIILNKADQFKKVS
jgi:GTP-binding protein EngB required for normal cell division